ncbi:MAG TPA: histidine kinase [Acidobacteriaceae bacterium]|nr:histidine kinase [Acidobacteriaceae bacterium]
MLQTREETAIRYPGFGKLLLGWAVLAGVACIRHVLLDNVPHAHLAREFADWLTCYLPWVLLTPAVFRLERKFPLNLAQWRRNAALLLAAGLVLSYAGGTIADVLFSLERIVLEPSAAAAPWWKMSGSEFLFQFALYCVALLAACLIRKLIEMQESERRAARLTLEKSELEASLRRSELEMIRMRLNPHFLFNSLQNLSTLARQNPDAASRMLARLGDVLRAALRTSAPAQTRLSSEIELTQAYVEVEQIRFDGRLSVLFEVEPGMDNALVPGFLFQPLVENAITHGLRDGQTSGAIWVRAVRHGEDLVLTVRDNGSGPPADRLADLEMGIGLGSTCERLERMFGDRHRVSVNRLPEGGTEVRITLPLEWAAGPAPSQVHEYVSSPHR